MTSNIYFSNLPILSNAGTVASTYAKQRDININVTLELGRSFERMLHTRGSDNGSPASAPGGQAGACKTFGNPYRLPPENPMYPNRSTDEASAIARMTDKLENLADNLRGKLDLEAFDDFESATDKMQAAAKRLSQNLIDKGAAHNFETAVDQLKNAVHSLAGKIDSEFHEMLRDAVNELDIATDKLKHILRIRGDDARAELSLHNVATKLDDVIDIAENLSYEIDTVGVNNGNDMPGRICGKNSAVSDSDSAPASSTPASNWTIDREARTIHLDNGYTLCFENRHCAWLLTDAEGNKVRIWGDPHVDEDADGKTDWDFKHDSTFVLNDGTKITVGTKNVGQRLTVTDNLTITKDDQAIMVTGIGDNKVRISDVMSNGDALDQVTNDGYVFRQGQGIDDWYTSVEITSDQAMDGRRDHEESV